MPEPTTAEARESRKQTSWIVALIGAASLLLVGMIAYILWDDRRTQYERMDDSTRFAADLLAANVEGMIHDVEEVLRGFDAVVQQLDPDTAGNGAETLRDVMDTIISRNPEIRTLLVLEPTGRIVHWNQNMSPPPDISGRDYVVAHMDRESRSMFIGAPVESYMDGRWVAGLSIPSRGSDGDLRRIVVAVTSLDLLHERFERLKIPEDYVLTIFTRTGRMLLRVPQVAEETALGREVPRAAWMWAWSDETGGGISASPIDGQERMMAYRKLETPGLLVVASSEITRVEEDWAYRLGYGIALVLLVVLSGAMVARRMIVTNDAMLMQNRALRDMATTDALTGLPNRFHFMEQGDHHVAGAIRYAEPICCLMIDCDHFKEVNDRFGHDGGDHALCQLADVIRAGLRDADVPCRMGGEEFAILLPHTSESGAFALAERLRSDVQDLTLSFSGHEEPIKLTVSIGIGSVDRGAQLSLNDLLKRADNALYAAKAAGRNRVFTTSDVPYPSALNNLPTDTPAVTDRRAPAKIN